MKKTLIIFLGIFLLILSSQTALSATCAELHGQCKGASLEAGGSGTCGDTATSKPASDCNYQLNSSECCVPKTTEPTTPCTNCKSACASTEEPDTSKKCTDAKTPICCKTKGTTAPGGSTVGGGGTSVSDLGQLSPIGSAELPAVIARIINTILGIVGSFSLVMIIYGGIVLLSAAGKQETIKKGKDILIWAIIGVLVVLSSYVAVTFIFNAVK